MTRPLRGATAAQTYSAILDLVRSSGVVSRIELADRSGLTEASISRIVRQLLAEGLVVEVGLGDRTGGKRRTLLQLNARSRHAVGVSLDFVRITYLLTDLGERRTVVAVTHRPELVARADRHVALTREGAEVLT